MFRRRVKIRTLLVMLGASVFVVAAGKSFHDYHRLGAEREQAAIEQQALDIYGYETASSLPKWLMEAFRPGPAIRLAALMEDAVLIGALAVAAHRLTPPT